MRNTIVRALTIGTAMLAALVMGSTVASAPPFTPGTWTITPGGPFNGSAGRITLSAGPPGQPPSVQFTCASSLVGGQLVRTATGSPATLGTLPLGSVRFSQCSAPSPTFTVQHVGTWTLQGITYDPAVGGGTTAGRIINVRINLSWVGCSATITGSVDATYTNSTWQLVIGPGRTLTVISVSGCFGLLQPGYTAAFNGVYTVSPAQAVTAVP